MTYFEPGLYCCSITTCAMYLFLNKPEEMKKLAKEFSEGNLEAEKDFLQGAQIIHDKFSKSEYDAEQIIGVITLYIPFLRKFHPNFTEKGFFEKTFQGKIFMKSDYNDLNNSIKYIETFLIRCLTGTADPRWINN